MKAIAIPYACYQNEPSIPINRIIDVPEDPKQLKTLLRNLMLERVCDDEDIVNSCELDYNSHYGDIEFGDGDIFIYLTYIG